MSRRTRFGSWMTLAALLALAAGCETQDEGGIPGADGTAIELPPDPIEGPSVDFPERPGATAGGGDTPKVAGGATETEPADTVDDSIVLSRTRYYRLDVDKLDNEVYVVVARQWVFEKAFPEGLLEAIKKDPKLKKADEDLFPSAGDEDDIWYIHWEPSESQPDISASLAFVEGDSNHELVVSVDLLLDRQLGKGQPKRQLKFGQLAVTVDLDSGRLGTVTWGDQAALPDGQGGDSGQEHTLQVSVTGSLTAESSATVKAADRLLADNVSTAFRSLARVPFSNESHHGITLGWLGLDHLRHGLIVMPRNDGSLYDFQYSVSGKSFELEIMRRQLAEESWPLVLRGNDYVGTTTDGKHVFEPVECMLSRPVAKPAVEKPEPPQTKKKAPAAKKKPAAKKPAAKKPATKKPATKKPATKKPATKKPATKKPATKKPAAKKPATKKPAAKKKAGG